jgi:four helix bundle protein
MKIESFEDLRVWQAGIQFVKQIYMVSKEGELSRDFGLRDQLRRASVSIPTNIAEGFERRSRKEYVNFLNIAKGSAGEVRSLLDDTFTAIDETGLIARVVNQESKPAKPDKNQPAEQIPAAS